jgi:arylsulfatase A-like enzyme
VRPKALFLTAVVVAAVVTPLPPRSARAAGPNILIIVTDDQREGLEVMPDTVKWFGQGGTYFDQAYATTPTCCPSRASIITGRYAHNHRVTNEEGAKVLNETTTLAHYLDRAGYHTALFGKYLNSWWIDRPPSNWDEFAYFKNSNAQTYAGEGWNIDGTITNTGKYATQYIADRAVRVIQSATRPWFLYLATPNPHGPYTAEPQYSSASVPPWTPNPAVGEADVSDKPPYVQSSSFSGGAKRRKAQLRTLMSVDDMVERVMSALEGSGQLTNTLAIFLSDNGYLWGEHRRCCKSTPYTQSIKVPMYARWPGHFAAGATDSRLAANIDVAPTVLQAAGVTASNAPIDGRSLLSDYRRSRLFLEFFKSKASAPPWASLVTPSYQYIEYNDGSGFREYYDLVKDPWQLENVFNNAVAGDEPTNAAQLAAQLAADKTCSGNTCP